MFLAGNETPGAPEKPKTETHEAQLTSVVGVDTPCEDAQKNAERRIDEANADAERERSSMRATMENYGIETEGNDTPVPVEGKTETKDEENGIRTLVENSKNIEAARRQLEEMFHEQRTPQIARHIIETIDRELMFLETTNRTNYERRRVDGKKVRLYEQLKQKRRNYEVFLRSRREEDRTLGEATESAENELIRYDAWYRKQEKDATFLSVEKHPEKVSPSSFGTEHHGFIPFLRTVHKTMEGGWLFKSKETLAGERACMQALVPLAEKNLESFRQLLSRAKPLEQSEISARLHEQCRRTYTTRARELAEFVAGIGFAGDRSDGALNGEKAQRWSKAAMEHMTLEESFEWLESTSRTINNDNWQSKDDEAAYAQFYNGCKEELFAKLQERKSRAGHDPQKVKEWREWNLKIAYFLSGRHDPSKDMVGGWAGSKVSAYGTFGGSEDGNFDTDFADPAYAAELAKNALDYENLALRYAEKNLSKKLPLRAELSEDRKNRAISHIPTALRNHPQVHAMVQMISGNPDTIEGLSAQYATLRNLEALFTGENPNIQAELEVYFTTYMRDACTDLASFLKGDWLSSASEADLMQTFGPLTAEQMQGWKLLADIEGHDWLDFSDTTMRYASVAAKITAMITAGIVLSAVTMGAGLGVVGTGIVGGMGMTMTGAALFHQGVNSREELVTTYGKDLAVNAGTMGLARYAQAARYLYEAKKAGDVAKGFNHLKTVWGGGTRFCTSLDEMAAIGSKLPLTGRLAAATVEGMADVATGTMIETALEGGDFVNNLAENAIFLPLGYAEFIGPAIRRMSDATTEQVQNAYRYTNSISKNWLEFSRLCGEKRCNPRKIYEHMTFERSLQGLSEEEKAVMRAAEDIVRQIEKDDLNLTELLHEIANTPSESSQNTGNTNDASPPKAPENPESDPMAKTSRQTNENRTSEKRVNAETRQEESGGKTEDTPKTASVTRAPDEQPPPTMKQPETGSLITGADGRLLPLEEGKLVSVMRETGSGGTTWVFARLTKKDDGSFDVLTDVYENLGSISSSDPSSAQRLHVSEYLPPNFRVNDTVIVHGHEWNLQSHGFGKVVKTYGDGTFDVIMHGSWETKRMRTTDMHMVDWSGEIIQRGDEGGQFMIKADDFYDSSKFPQAITGLKLRKTNDAGPSDRISHGAEATPKAPVDPESGPMAKTSEGLNRDTVIPEPSYVLGDATVPYITHALERGEFPVVDSFGPEGFQHGLIVVGYDEAQHCYITRSSNETTPRQVATTDARYDRNTATPGSWGWPDDDFILRPKDAGRHDE